MDILYLTNASEPKGQRRVVEGDSGSLRAQEMSLAMGRYSCGRCYSRRDSQTFPDQTPAPAPEAPIMSIIVNTPGIMQDDKNNRYMTNEEFDAVLSATGYAIVTPATWLCAYGCA